MVSDVQLLHVIKITSCIELCSCSGLEFLSNFKSSFKKCCDTYREF